MAHAGTMVGGSAQTKQSGSPWPAIALTVAVAVATVAGVGLASSAGLVGGTAKPAADRSYDQIEAQRGAITLSSDPEYLNGILDKAHAAPYVGARSRRRATAAWPMTRTSRHLRPGARNAVRRRRGHAFDLSATSGTFHPGKPADQSASWTPGPSGTRRAGHR